MLAAYRLRMPDQKREAVKRFKELNFKVVAAGDSYNDTAMLGEAHRGILFHPPENVIREFPQFPVTLDYDELRREIDRAFRDSSRPRRPSGTARPPPWAVGRRRASGLAATAHTALLRLRNASTVCPPAEARMGDARAVREPGQVVATGRVLLRAGMEVALDHGLE